jgi:hypothetical protein
MELNFTEMDNLDKNSYENFNAKSNESSEPKYWEKTQKKNNIPKKKKVSFDDILSNMNLVVNQNGVLQSMAPLQQYDQPQYYQEQQQYHQQPYQQQQQYQQQQYQQQQYQQQPYQQIQKNSDPLDPSVKHSYIFNKYFKDYKDANNNFQPQVKVPKTIEEYKQMVLEERIRQIQERNRIAQIKSKKMFYTSNPHMQENVNQGVIKPTKNNLRSMNFR